MRLRKRFCLAVTALTMAAATAFAQAPSVDHGGAGGTIPFTLGPSDVILVWVWQEADLTMSVTVRPDGKVSLPLVGEVDVAGRSPLAVEQEIQQRLAAYVVAPVVVIVEQINSLQVTVLGEVGAPGRYPLQQQLTVLDIIALAGGFTQFANRDKVTVLRREGTGVQPITVDLKGLLRNGSEAPLFLRPGDTVYVK